MANPRKQNLETATARLRLAVRKRPYAGPSLARGIKLLYRRNRTNGTWIVKAASGGAYWTKRVAEADDFETSDNRRILTFYEAQAAAKRVARGDTGTPDSKPLTVREALTEYERDLRSRGADGSNARRVLVHLTGPLAGKPVAQVTARDLKAWRDHLAEKGVKPATINRSMNGLRASLNAAATLDHRLNPQIFRQGLKRLPNANRARRMVLADVDVLKIVAAAFEEEHALGVLVQVLAETGCRKSQAVRLRCCDLQADRADPRLLVPTSFKGRGQKERQHVPVPIGVELAALLKAMKDGRDGDAPLLIKPDGTPWHATNKTDVRDPFRAVATRAGFDPDVITSYAMRHSSICRALLAGVPVSVVAKLHDTSGKEIEAHYAAYILDHADDLARRALLRAATATVVPLSAGRSS
jgi:integrase